MEEKVDSVDKVPCSKSDLSTVDQLGEIHLDLTPSDSDRLAARLWDYVTAVISHNTGDRRVPVGRDLGWAQLHWASTSFPG